MNPINLILMVLAFVLLLVSIKWNPPGYNLTAAGLASWALAVILSGFP